MNRVRSALPVLLLLASCPNPIDSALARKVEDQTPPEITILSPDPAVKNYFGSIITITGVVTDSAGRAQGSIQSLSYEEQYNKRIHGSTADGAVTLAADGGFTITFSAIDPEMLSGTQVIVLTAVDWNGNSATDFVTLYDKTSGPIIVVYDHGPLDYNKYSSALNAALTIRGRVEVPTITFKYDVEAEDVLVLSGQSIVLGHRHRRFPVRLQPGDRRGFGAAALRAQGLRRQGFQRDRRAHRRPGGPQAHFRHGGRGQRQREPGVLGRHLPHRRGGSAGGRLFPGLHPGKRHGHECGADRPERHAGRRGHLDRFGPGRHRPAQRRRDDHPQRARPHRPGGQSPRAGLRQPDPVPAGQDRPHGFPGELPACGRKRAQRGGGGADHDPVQRARDGDPAADPGPQHGGSLRGVCLRQRHEHDHPELQHPGDSQRGSR